MSIITGGIEAAKDYASLGWRVVILHGSKDGGCTCRKGSDCPSPAKHPRQTQWPEKATSDAKAIERLFAKWPASNLGVRLGPTSGLVDVEFDDAEGQATAERLLGDIQTPTFTSHRSTHRLFRFPDGLSIPKAVVTVQGLEMRFGTDDKGAQSVFPPSVHASGVVYRWLDGLSPDDVELADFPRALVSLVTSSATVNGSGRLEFTMSDSGDTLATHPGASKPKRHDTLMRLIGKHVKANGIISDLVNLALAFGARCSPPIPDADTLERVAAIVNKEQAKGIQTGAGCVSSGPALELRSRCYSDIEAVPVEWLWEGRIAAGKLTLIVGEPGLGKTTVCCDIAARISRSDAFPDGIATPQQGEAAILTAEDGAEDTIRPRLDSVGANVERIHHIDCVADSTGKEHWLSLAAHLPIVEAWLDKHPSVCILILDPISAFMGEADTHRNSEVRAILGPLSKMAERRGIAVVGINHLTKGEAKAINRILGSIAFVAAARAVWLVGTDPDDESRRLFLPVKNNLAPATGLAFTIDRGLDGQGRVVWDSTPVLVSADDIDDRDNSPRDEAKEWLAGLLVAGTVASSEVFKQAKADGITERTLNRAKKELGVKSGRDGNRWVWFMPDNDPGELVI